MVADIKSERWPASRRNGWPASVGIRNVFICKMRRKLANASGGKNYIETVWGRGYALRENAPEMRAMAG